MLEWGDGFAVINRIGQGAKAKLIDDNPLRERAVQKPPLDPDVADTAPSDSVLTAYDEEHLVTSSARVARCMPCN
jgi:hypothetical protein